MCNHDVDVLDDIEMRECVITERKEQKSPKNGESW